jgi:RNA polymerase sigma-70 factor (ECF subfamily)
MESRLASHQQTAEGNLLMREKVRHVWAAADRLPRKQRTVFMLRFVEEMELSEIAETTGLHLGTVKSHLYRALRAVRVELGEDGRSSSAPGIRRFAMATEM